MLAYVGISYAVMQTNKTAFEVFYAAAVADKIIGLAPANHGASVILHLAGGQHYRIFPAKQNGGARALLAAAAVGDSVRKESRSATLLLLKKRQVLRYSCDRILY